MLKIDETISTWKKLYKLLGDDVLLIEEVVNILYSDVARNIDYVYVTDQELDVLVENLDIFSEDVIKELVATVKCCAEDDYSYRHSVGQHLKEEEHNALRPAMISYGSKILKKYDLESNND